MVAPDNLVLGAIFAFATITAYGWGHHDGRKINAAFLASLKADLDTANDRLYAAWQQGAQIPPRPAESAAPPQEPLSPLMQGIVDQWSSPEGKLEAEKEIRAKLLTGMSEAAIFRESENSVGLT